jgi:hypothetical protein
MKVVLENRPEQDCYYDRTKYYLPNIPNAWKIVIFIC